MVIYGYLQKSLDPGRPLSDLITKNSSINSFSTILFGNKQEQELDIILDIESLLSKNLTIQIQSLKKAKYQRIKP
ncbi:hypothetical protein C1646_764446 [Rhizophagus diaphanus]|nr:hypothetical protein C1646_764446 [Rhizophagus diaphanus] [Rhizophagus sp. MUCL 43196]